MLTDSKAHNQVAKGDEEDAEISDGRAIGSDVARLVERPPFSLIGREAVLDGRW